MTAKKPGFDEAFLAVNKLLVEALNAITNFEHTYSVRLLGIDLSPDGVEEIIPDTGLPIDARGFMRVAELDKRIEAAKKKFSGDAKKIEQIGRYPTWFGFPDFVATLDIPASDERLQNLNASVGFSRFLAGWTGALAKKKAQMCIAFDSLVDNVGIRRVNNRQADAAVFIGSMRHLNGVLIYAGPTHEECITELLNSFDHWLTLPPETGIGMLVYGSF